jgi:DNA-binding IclR family transcriptional regulator
MCPAGRDASLNSVLGKVFAILDGFGHDDQGVTIGDLVARTGLAKSTTHRLLRELIAHGAVDTNEAGRYHLGLRLFELARLVPTVTDLREAALPFIEDLYEATHETVHLGVLDGLEVVYIERIAGHGASPVPTRVGGRMPAYCTSLGKAMLAFAPEETLNQLASSNLTARTPYTITVPAVLRQELRRIAESGVAFDREEARIGLVCVAAPVFGADGRVAAALSVSGPSPRMKPEQIASAVRTASLGLSRLLRNGRVGRPVLRPRVPASRS